MQYVFIKKDSYAVQYAAVKVTGTLPLRDLQFSSSHIITVVHGALMTDSLNVASERQLNVSGPREILRSGVQRSLSFQPVSQLKDFKEHIPTQPSHG